MSSHPSTGCFLCYASTDLVVLASTCASDVTRLRMAESGVELAGGIQGWTTFQTVQGRQCPTTTPLQLMAAKGSVQMQAPTVPYTFPTLVSLVHRCAIF